MLPINSFPTPTDSPIDPAIALELSLPTKTAIPLRILFKFDDATLKMLGYCWKGGVKNLDDELAP